MGALIMTHSDDNGLVLPPKLAPFQVVIVPIYKGKEQMDDIVAKAKDIKMMLETKGISVKLDDRDTHKPGWKFAEYELKGVPLRIAIGPKDLENNTVELARRDTLTKEIISQNNLVQTVQHLLIDIQENLYEKALHFQKQNTYEAETYDEFKKILEEKGGFIYAYWDGSSETEQKIKEETKATIRCIPLHQEFEEGKCIYTGKPAKQKVIFAKAY
jgi:prolyl-tRNA synthetase